LTAIILEGVIRALLLRGLPALLGAYLLYLYGLSSVGLLGPDEPRYAAIGREMALTGDWITPRLWGSPWFEKPALLYWLTASAFNLGLGDDLAPRLPVALLSLAFLAFFFRRMRSWFNPDDALRSTLILGTSAGWIAMSQVGVTDVPLAVTFSAAMLVGFRLVESESPSIPTAVLSGSLFGLAVLAKGLVPLVLALPLVVWILYRRRFLHLLALGTAMLAIAGPWYALCYARNGWPFIEELFIRHHFSRLASPSLQHVQPFWFYAPVLAGLLFPWWPLLPSLFRRVSSPRHLFLVLWLAWGFLFFSVSLNKLPAYLLPLMPAAAALLGTANLEARWTKIALGLSALSFLILPVLSSALPQILAAGLSRADLTRMLPWWSFALVAGLLFAIVVWPPRSALLAIAAAAVFGVAYLKVSMYPSLDATASARSLWQTIAPRRHLVCTDNIHRAWLYGLNYYAIAPLPTCEEGNYPIRLVPGPGNRPVIERPVEARRLR
jgi:4-amino-4-deoxy-L-arabinose transferase-like glycosyltransferase